MTTRLALLICSLALCCGLVAAPGASAAVTAPDTVFQQTPPSPTNDTTPSFTVGSDNPGSVFQCRWASSASEGWGSGAGVFACGDTQGSMTYTADHRADGTHHLVVRACVLMSTVPFIKCDTTPAKASVEVDTHAPPTIFGPNHDNGRHLRERTGYHFTTFERVDSWCGIDVPDDAIPVCPEMNLAYVGGPELSQGEHTLKVRARDMAGNLGAVGTRTFVWDTIAPVTSPVEGPQYTNNRRPTYTYAATDADDVLTVTCHLRELLASVAVEVPCGQTSWTPDHDLPPGPHELRVVHTDRAGNESAPVTRSFSVDVVAPELGDIVLDAASRQLRWTASGNSGARCSLDGAKAEWCTSPYALGDLRGRHTLQVEAYDMAGNTTTRSLEFDAPAPPDPGDPNDPGDPRDPGSGTGGGKPGGPTGPDPSGPRPAGPGGGATGGGTTVNGGGASTGKPAGKQRRCSTKRRKAKRGAGKRRTAGSRKARSAAAPSKGRKAAPKRGAKAKRKAAKRSCGKAKPRKRSKRGIKRRG